MAYLVDPDWIPSPLIAHGERPLRIAGQRRRSLVRRFALALRTAGWLVALAWTVALRRPFSVGLARRLRDLLDDIGGAAIKLGQLLSLRSDFFSIEFCDVLATLQFAAAGFPPELARRSIEGELGCPLDEVFDVFDDHPVAAASIAQVHRARLRRDQTWVAVKIQRPGIAERFARDLAVVRRCLRVLARLPGLGYFSWDEMAWELDHLILEEVDYRYEAANMRRMRRTLRHHDVRVPRVFGYSTQRLLVMEYLPGVLMSDILEVGQRDPARLARWLSDNGVDLERVGMRLFDSFQRQCIEDRVFHADLHPGNIMVFRDSRVALIDLGSVGIVDPEIRDYMFHYNRAVADQDVDAIADYLVLQTARLPATDPEQLRLEVSRVIARWLQRSRVTDLPYQERSIARGLVEVGNIIARHQVLLSWQLMRVNRATLTLDASLAFLLARHDQAALTRRYMKQVDRRIGATLGARASELASALIDDVRFVYLLAETLRDREARRFRGATGKLSLALSRVFLAGELAAGVAVVDLVVRGRALSFPALALALGFELARRMRRRLATPEMF
jgi:ubiquinone biosynthesis protein